MQGRSSGYLWPNEWAKAKGVSKQTVYNWMDAGRLPYIEVPAKKKGSKPHRAIRADASVQSLPGVVAPPGTMALKAYALSVGREVSSVRLSCHRGTLRYTTTPDPMGKVKYLYWIYVDQVGLSPNKRGETRWDEGKSERRVRFAIS